MLTHWGPVMHICVGNLTSTGSDNGLSPGRCQAIIRTNAGILLIGPLETSFSEILITIFTFSFNKMHLKMASAKWRSFCLGLNVLKLFCGNEDSAETTSSWPWLLGKDNGFKKKEGCDSIGFHLLAELTITLGIISFKTINLWCYQLGKCWYHALR